MPFPSQVSCIQIISCLLLVLISWMSSTQCPIEWKPLAFHWRTLTLLLPVICIFNGVMETCLPYLRPVILNGYCCKV